MQLKRFLITLCILAGCGSVYAQKQGQSRIDSLLLILPEAQEDSTKVFILSKLCYTYFAIDPNEGIRYGKEGLELAEKLQYKYGAAEIHGYLGINYAVKADYTTSLEQFHMSLNILEEIDQKNDIPTVLVNIGNVYQITSNYPKAIEYYIKALKKQEDIGDKNGVALSSLNIGLIYKNQAEYEHALDYLKSALEIFEETGDQMKAANALSAIGLVYRKLNEDELALKYFTDALKIQENLGLKDGIAKSSSYIASMYLKDHQYERGLEKIQRSLQLAWQLENEILRGDGLALMGEMYLAVAKETESKRAVLNSFSKSKMTNLMLAESYLDSAISIQVAIDNLRGLVTSYQRMSEVKVQLDDFEGAFESQRAYKITNDSLFNLEKDKKITQTEMQYAFEKKEAAARAEQDKKDAVAQAELKRVKNIRNSALGGAFVFLVFTVVFYFQRNKIKAAQQRSDDLLHNILPEEIAKELKENGESEARDFDNVTVLFSDFKGFTQTAAKLNAKALVKEINTCFKAFDEIMTKHNLEKIKTIGDAYMAAGGLQEPRKTEPIDVVNAGIEMQAFMLSRKVKNEKANEPYFEMRLGIHTGPVVAGIVGVKKFQYDIWGDTVNTASRMESAGEVGKVNISQATFELLKDLPDGQAGDPQFAFENRGKIEVKGKGEMEMYFIELKNK